MNNIFLWLLLMPLTMEGQFVPRALTPTPGYLIWGQSNGENFWQASLYNSGSTLRHADILSHQLKSHYATDSVANFLQAVAGKGLSAITGETDWHHTSTGELYDISIFNLISDTTLNSSRPYIGAYRTAGRVIDVKFMVWIQGERDASDNTYAAAYYINLKTLVANLRNDLNKPALPVIIVKLWDELDRPLATLDTVRAAQQQLADEDPQVYIINIDDFTSADYSSPGNVHYGVQGLGKIKDRILSIVTTNGL